MNKLPPDLEALMPEPVKLVTACEDCCGTGHTGESQYMGEFQPPEYERCGSCDGSGKWIVDHHSPTQMREAILAATERAAKVCDEMADRLSMQWRQEHKTSAHLEGQSDGAFDCATAIRGAAASTGRGEGGEGV